MRQAEHAAGQQEEGEDRKNAKESERVEALEGRDGISRGTSRIAPSA